MGDKKLDTDFMDMSDEEFAALAEPDFSDEPADDKTDDPDKAKGDDPDEDPSKDTPDGEDDPEEGSDTSPEGDVDPDSDEDDKGEDGKDQDKGEGESDEKDDPKKDEPEKKDDEKPEGTLTADALGEVFKTGFKANGRQVVPKSPEDLIRLAQQGANYHQKMAGMKPARKALKTLESNGLLDDAELNFLIDLKNGKPEAIAKFMKDKAINPMDVDTTADVNYTPTDHSVSDTELEVDAVLDEIQDTPTFTRTVNAVTKEWDESSRAEVSRQPRIMSVINEHMANGTYDKVMGAVQYERSMGRLTGVSDFDAYKDMGQHMSEQGLLNPVTPNKDTEKKDTPTHKSVDPAAEQKRKEQKKKASPTRNKGKATPKVPEGFNPLDLSDEDFKKFDPKTIGLK